MNLLFHIRQKGKIALLLLAVILLEIFCSHTYTNNIIQMGNSFSEVYSDRLIAQDYIYKLSGILHKRKYSLAHHPISDNEIHALFSDYGLRISLLLNKYEKTKLTDDENILFHEFKNNILLMLNLEQKYIASNNKDVKNNLLKQQYKLLNLSIEQLDKLSAIQLARGKNLNEASQKIVSFSALLNQFDWALVIIIGLTIQALIFASRSSIAKHPQNQYLN